MGRKSGIGEIESGVGGVEGKYSEKENTMINL